METEADKAAEPAEETGNERERSTIGFPYGDLDTAMQVAKGVHEVGGSSCEIERNSRLGMAKLCENSIRPSTAPSDISFDRAAA